MEGLNQNNNHSQKSNEEEADLGQLLLVIGRGFSKLFNFIGRIITRSFHWFLSIIIFIKKHIIIIGISSISGLGLGYIYQDYYYVTKYQSSMNVRPNFGSTVQLYRVVQQYQSLVGQRDYKRLSENLNISEEQAQKITRFSVEPYSNKNQSVKAYGRFIRNLDSTIVKSITLKEFTDNQPVESFEFHIINVISKDKYIFSKLGSPIINSIENNDFYKTERATSYSNLLVRKKVLESSIIELENIQKLQKNIMLKESEKENKSGTNIYLGDTENKKLISYKEFIELDGELAEVNKKIVQNKTIVNVITKFDDVGKVVYKWFKSYLYLGFAMGFLLSFSVLSLIKMNVKLKDYEEMKNKR